MTAQTQLATDQIITSPQWRDWIKYRNSFRFEFVIDVAIPGTTFTNDRTCSFTAIRQGKDKAFWYAHKKINGHLRREYLGIDQELDLVLLREKAIFICSDTYDRQKQVQRSERKKKQSLTPADKCETETFSPSRSGEEIAKLRAELEEVKADRDRQLIRIAELQNRMHQELASGFSEKDKRIQELDNANWQLEKRYDTLNEMYRKSETARAELQAELNTLKAKA